VTLSLVVGALVTVAMAVVGWLGWRRWSVLDAGGRWLVAGVGVSLATALVMLGMVLAGRPTRAVHEIQLLLQTSVTLNGFARWQRRRSARLALLWAAAAFAIVWVGVAVGERWVGPFSTVSAPIAHTLRAAAAGYTLIAMVQATPEQWTRHLWFWFSTATMLIYGTEVVLDPLWQRAFGVRDDLVFAAYVFNQLAGLAGYALMARGLLPPDPVPGARLQPAAR
jgi:hypothetical protein